MSERKALVVGVTGTTGFNAAKQLVASGWEVHGVSRRPGSGLEGVTQHSVDLTDRGGVADALGGGGFTHVFFCIWIRHETEEENRKTNSAIVADVLDALSPGKTVEHVALVTGLKHYLGPFEAYAKAPATLPSARTRTGWSSRTSTTTRRTRSSPPPNGHGFTWSVHRAAHGDRLRADQRR